MLGTCEERVADIIVLILARMPVDSIEHLHAAILQEHRKVSLKAIYKETQKLQRVGVVVRTKNFVGLNLNWLVKMEALINHGYDTWLSSTSAHHTLPAANQRLSWKFSDLRRLDDFVVHLLNIMLGVSSAGTVFCWTEHPWFALLHPEKEHLFETSLKNRNVQQHLLIEQDTFLARSTTAIYRNGAIKVHFERSRITFPPGTSFFGVAGDLLIYEKLDLETDRRINSLYKCIQSKSDIDPRALVELFSRKSSATVVLQRNSLLANRYTRKFKQYLA